ncbi:MAG: protease family protein [Acidobacteriaceae bacterium]|nr:protease family protein [Acidobacteriaceae bacterium]
MSGLSRQIITRPRLIRSVALYYAIAIGWAWAVWAPLVLGVDGLKILSISPSLPVLTCIATLGPSLGCFITHRIETGNWAAIHLLPGTKGRWIWFLLGPLLVLICNFVVFPVFVSSGSPALWRWHPSVLTGLWFPMFNYNLLGGPLFEEPGWRGFLQPRLEEIMHPWVAAICVGIMWAAWHIPLFFVTWSSASPASFLLIEIGVSILIAFALNSAGRAILVAILMHAAFNASSRFLDPFLGQTPTRSCPSGEMILAWAYLFVAAVIILSTRGRLRSAERKVGPFRDSRDSAL